MLFWPADGFDLAMDKNSSSDEEATSSCPPNSSNGAPRRSCTLAASFFLGFRYCGLGGGGVSGSVASGKCEDSKYGPPRASPTSGSWFTGVQMVLESMGTLERARRACE